NRCALQAVQKLQGSKWPYQDFLRRHEGQRVVFLELGVGGNTPAIIKYPFWIYTLDTPNAVYACVNYGEAFVPQEIVERSVCINSDIGEFLAACQS
nr:hypothetical protein [Oscillospiraceae bacterium]